MLNKKVLLCWAGLDFLYFAAGIVCLFFVCAWPRVLKMSKTGKS